MKKNGKGSAKEHTQVDEDLLAAILSILQEDKLSADRTNAQIGDTIYLCTGGDYDGMWRIDGKLDGEESFVFIGLGKSRDSKLTNWMREDRPEIFI
ncbi:hypothetical protein [Leptonema illini]|uniref:Uncharacterized protein n=1 Tax=Leptonema illini DSM 21528 TaxID=929563 RepID=H2CBP1_9LEPT|nr:hypothetical protein [Leptonema illini]EHQ07416.1 hypothetical protein Lepil_2745 [Leptonema illini DSM 21528]